MPFGPSQGDLPLDVLFEEMVGYLCSRPATYVHPVTLGAVCAYLDGFNTARSGGPLIGLQQWLVVRANTGDNLHWTGLVRLKLAASQDDVESRDEERYIRDLGRLLAEFFDYRRANGISKVFHEYARWLLRRSWYKGPLRRKHG